MFIVAPVENGYIVTITEKGSGIKKQKIASNKEDVIELFREYDAKQNISKSKTKGKVDEMDEALKKILGGGEDE